MAESDITTYINKQKHVVVEKLAPGFHATELQIFLGDIKEELEGLRLIYFWYITKPTRGNYSLKGPFKVQFVL